MDCSICGAKLRGVHDNHNAAPVNDGRCCTRCNADVVIPARCEWIRNSKPEDWRSIGEIMEDTCVAEIPPPARRH